MVNKKATLHRLQQAVMLITLLWTSIAWGQAALLNAVDISVLDTKGIEVVWHFNQAVSTPEQLWLEEPYRLVLDFESLDTAEDFLLPTVMGQGQWLKSVDVVNEGAGLQTVIELGKKVNYQVIPQDHSLKIRFYENSVPLVDTISPSHEWVERTIEDLKFTSSGPGEGVLKILYDSKSLPVEYQDSQTKMTLKFPHTDIDEAFLRNFDVSVLGTPVSEFEVTKSTDDVLLMIHFARAVTPVAYENEEGFFVEFLPKQTASPESGSQYDGEPISLNFQNIEVRAILQLLADFSNFNVVTSDSVMGTITLRLKSVPWDQALDLILKIKGLDSRLEGNVLLVAPTEELAEQERILLESTQEIEDLSPLISELIQINYAKATELATFLKKDDVSVLSPRGRVTVDDRTNSLLIYETPKKLSEIKALIKNLDRPIRQVLIEAKIIKATDDFEKALGVRFGATAHTLRHGFNQAGIAGNLNGSNTLGTSDGSYPQDLSVVDRLNVSLPKTLSTATGGSGSIAFTIARLPLDTVLDLELSALENEGLGEVVSSPKLVMANQQTAYIESGEEIPYNETTSSGAASIAFKKAVLRLEVTPQITPDDHIILDLLVNQDSRGTTVGSVPAIDKQEMKTQALVRNGETIVLGGVYKQTTSKNVTKVPLLGDIPYLGRLFRNEDRLDQREELLIFVTPKIIFEDKLDDVKTFTRTIKPMANIRRDD